MQDRKVIRDNHKGFTKKKLCQTNLEVFCDGVTTSVNKGRATDVIYLDFCKAFDSVPCNILAVNMKRHGFNEWTVRWARNWLDGHIRRAAVNNCEDMS